MNPLSALNRFFFQEISTRGFGLVRIGWALTAFCFFLLKAPELDFFYGMNGLNPSHMQHSVFRSEYRVTLLEIFPDPTAHVVLYALLMAALFTAMIGLLPRISVLISLVLMFSFNERNLLILGGGDTTLRTVGLILAIAPCIDAFSMNRLIKQWHHWKTHRTLLPEDTMSIWPMRLVLWQLIIIYGFSLLDKLAGTMWTQGTAVATTMQHLHFARLHPAIMDVLSGLSLPISWGTLIFEAAWLLLLVPRSIRQFYWPQAIPWSLKRILMYCGALFHIGIFICMRVGSFSQAMLTAYCGILIDEDWTAFKRIFNRKWNRLYGAKRIIILNDFTCRLCRRSAFFITLIDWLSRVQTVDYHNETIRKKHAATIPKKELDHAMHIVLPDGRIFSGFKALRELCQHLLPLRLFYPLLYLPGMTLLGEKIYRYVAANRKKCIDGACAI